MWYSPRALRDPIRWALSALAVALYAVTLGFDFALDDVAVITQNRFVQQGLAGIPRLLTTFYWQGYWETNAGLYRPLSLLTFALEWQLAPGRAGLGHAVNVALYGVTAWHVYGLLAGWRVPKRVAGLTTALFIAHPLHSEVVANIKSRDELLCFLFFVLTARALPKSSWRAALFFALGLLSKESALAFVPVLAISCWWFERDDVRRVLRRLWPLLAVTVLFIAVHEAVIRSAPTPPVTFSYQDNSLVTAPDGLSQKAMALTLLVRGVGLTLWPSDLSYDYSFNTVRIVGPGAPLVWLAVLLLGGALFVIVRGWRVRSFEAWGLVLFLATWVFTGNLLFLTGTTFAERLWYAPSFGLALAFAAAAHRFMSGRGFVVFGAACVVPLMLVTVARVPDWKDDFTLYTTGPRTQPGSARVHYNAGTAYLRMRALGHPQSAQRTKALADAAAELLEAVRIDPHSGDAYLNLAVTRYHQGDYAGALTYTLDASREAPMLGAPHAVAGNALFRMQRFPESIEQIRTAISLGFIDDDTFNFLGAALLQTGDYRGAVDAFSRGVERTPNNAELQRNLQVARSALANEMSVPSK